MKIDDEFYVVLLNKTDICYSNHPALAIYSTLESANELRIDLHLRFPGEEYTVKKIKIEIA